MAGISAHPGRRARPFWSTRGEIVGSITSRTSGRSRCSRRCSCRLSPCSTSMDAPIHRGLPVREQSFRERWTRRRFERCSRSSSGRFAEGRMGSAPLRSRACPAIPVRSSRPWARTSGPATATGGWFGVSPMLGSRRALRESSSGNRYRADFWGSRRKPRRDGGARGRREPPLALV